MFQLKKLLDLKNFTNFLLALIPISLIAGSLIINLNIFFFLIAGIILIRKHQFTFQFNKIKIFISIFFISIIISSLINIKIVGYENLIKSILLLRFLILYFVIDLLLINNLLNLRKLFIVSLICTSFISSDVIIQYVYGKNIFGNEPLELFDSVIPTSVFGDEAIAGGYIQKFFLLSFASLLILCEKNKIFQIYFIPITLLHILAIFVSTNRMPFVLIIFSIFLLIIFLKKFRINLIICLVLSLSASMLVAKNDFVLFEKYNGFYKKIFGASANNSLEYEKLNKLNFFSGKISSTHGLNYITTFESFQESMIIGKGLKSIRSNCKNISLSTEREVCLNHPHNFHLEVLHDTGLIGYLFISLFVIFTFINSLKNFHNKEKYVEKGIFILILLNFFLEIWPLKSSGSLLSSWTGSVSWLMVALTSYNLKKLT